MERSAPLQYPLLGLLAIIGSIPVTVFFLDRERGYYIALAVLLLIIVYGVLFTETPWTIDLRFLGLFGGYWLGLLLHYHYFPHEEIVPYIVVTPIAVLATVVLLPRFIDAGRDEFTIGLTLLGVLATLIGLFMLHQELQATEPIYERVGTEIYGRWELRTTSVFHNPNTTGFFMMVGSFAGLYAFMRRRGLLWLVAFALCLLGLVLSEGDAALLGFALGFAIVLSGFSVRYAYAGFGLVLLGIYLAIHLEHLQDVMDSTLMSRINRWVLAIDSLSEAPLWGHGFIDHREVETYGRRASPHNSYIRPLFNMGVIFGGLYLASLAYAFATGLRKRWTPWNAYVVGTCVGVFTYLMFEEQFLGGLSVHSIVLGLMIGLLLVPEGDDDGLAIGGRPYGLLAYDRLKRAVLSAR